MNERIWTAALAVIGDEILSGRTQDKNIAQVGAWLNVQGIRLAEVRVVPDKTAAIVEAVNALSTRYDYLFTTGGIGPTHDDITVDAIAEALGVSVVYHPKAVAMLERYYAPRGGLTDIRKRMAETGGPEGFEDVVASINQLGDDQPDTPAHWSVTFGVDDADATASKAKELGGKVVVPPFDAPWVRMTILTDPQGATFTASKFVPPEKTDQPEGAAAASGA